MSKARQETTEELHFAAAKQSATRVARIEKATAAIFEGRGFLERG